MSHNLTISGNTTFSGTVSGPTPTLDSHLATKGYVDSEISQWKVEKVFEISRNKVYTAKGEYVVDDRESLPVFDPGLYFVKIDYDFTCNGTSSGNRSGYIGIASGNYEIGATLERADVLIIANVYEGTSIAGTMYINPDLLYTNSSMSAGITKNMSIIFDRGYNERIALYITNSYLCIANYIRSGISVNCNLVISYYRITTNL